MAKIRGTNVDLEDLDVKEDPITGKSWEKLFAETNDPNDVLFHMAYVQEGRGQGNKSVGAVQSGMWGLTGDVAEKAGGKSWAEEAVRSESGTSDIYVERDEQGNVREDDQGRAITHTGVDFGKPMTPDDVARSTPGVTRFAGTNIPTTGIPQADIDRINQRLIDEIEKGDKNMAADAIHEATNALWKSTGLDADTNQAAYKQFMSQLYSDQFTFNPATGLLGYTDIVTKDPTKGTSDFYNIRDLSGNIVRSVQGRDYTGTPTYNPSQIGAGGSGEYLSTPYSRPALQDWSHLAAPRGPGLLGSAPAQLALQRDNMANLQPWAQGGVLDYAPRGGSTWAPRTYAANPLNNQTTTTTNNTTTTDNGYTGPLGNQWDSYHDWYMADRPSWGDPAGYTTSPLGGHQAALNRLYEAYRSPLLAAGTEAKDVLSYDDWFRGQGTVGAAAGPIFGGVLGNGQ